MEKFTKNMYRTALEKVVDRLSFRQDVEKALGGEITAHVSERTHDLTGNEIITEFNAVSDNGSCLKLYDHKSGGLSSVSPPTESQIDGYFSVVSTLSEYIENTPDWPQNDNINE